MGYFDYTMNKNKLDKTGLVCHNHNMLKWMGGRGDGEARRLETYIKN